MSCRVVRLMLKSYYSIYIVSLLTDILCLSSSECGIDFSEDFLREKFESIDEDGSGELDEEEMRALFDSLGRPVSKRVIANIMRLSDTDGNGMFFFSK